MKNQVVKMVVGEVAQPEISASEAWKYLNERGGKEVVVKITNERTAGNEYPTQFSVRGTLEIGAGQARVLVSVDTYVYFGEGDVEAVIDGRASDGMLGVHLSF